MRRDRYENDRRTAALAESCRLRLSATSRRPESSRAAPALGKTIDSLESGACHGGEDELSDAIAAGKCDRLRAEVGENHADLAAIVAVDRSGSVQRRQTVLRGQSAAHP